MHASKFRNCAFYWIGLISLFCGYLPRPYINELLIQLKGFHQYLKFLKYIFLGLNLNNLKIIFSAKRKLRKTVFVQNLPPLRNLPPLLLAHVAPSLNPGLVIAFVKSLLKSLSLLSTSEISFMVEPSFSLIYEETLF